MTEDVNLNTLDRKYPQHLAHPVRLRQREDESYEDLIIRLREYAYHAKIPLRSNEYRRILAENFFMALERDDRNFVMKNLDSEMFIDHKIEVVVCALERRKDKKWVWKEWFKKLFCGLYT